MTKNYIGLANTFHDSALAVVSSSGEVVFAEATERYLQNKRSINCVPDFFHRAYQVVRRHTEPGAELVVAQSWSDRTPALMQATLDEVSREEQRLEELFGEVPEFMRTHVSSRKYYARALTNLFHHTGNTLAYELNQAGDRGYLTELDHRKYDHHLTHAAAACYSSPYQEAVCAVIDGLGEGSSTCCYRYRDGEITAIDEVPNQSPGSLGLFYTLVCVTCGFGHLTGEEWKVMGLAAYGEHDPELYDLFRQMIRVDGLTIHFADDATLFGLLQKIHRRRRKPEESPFAAVDLAHAGQKVFTEVYFEFLSNLQQLGISGNLVLSGGCALNSAANGRVLDEAGFDDLYIFSAPGDDGNALGAALLAYHQDHPEARSSATIQLPFLGSTFSEEKIGKMRQFGPTGFEQLPDAELYRRTAAALAEGKIVGWATGRAEYGPRALGNRSILADPRDPEMKKKINARIKFRESFRPFAPAILHEFGSDYFVGYQEAPYMERTLPFREEVRDKVPAVVHEDGTGRLQTVKEEWNERYYRVIREFYEQTGVPLVLNTSFNVMGKPIIHTVEDALAVFYTSGLDVLVLGDLYLEK